MKLNKKGFTLIELLAVIAILAILVVLAVPNILNLFQDSRTRAYQVDAQSVYEAAQTQWQLDQFGSNHAAGDTTYSDSNNPLTNSSISKAAKYCVKINNKGEVTWFAYSQAGFYAHPTGSKINKNDITISQAETQASCGS